MKKLRRCLGVVLLGGLVSGLAGCQQAASEPNGFWGGTVKTPAGEAVRFALLLEKPVGSVIQGTLLNGQEKLAASSGTWDAQARRLRLRFDFYDGELDATIQGKELTGKFTRQWQKQTLVRELQATRDAQLPVPSVSHEAINGEWILRVGDAPQEKLWRARFNAVDPHLYGAPVTGTVIPVSGDWGEMTGVFDGKELQLHRFDGINARTMKLTLQADGTLRGQLDLGLFDPQRNVVAERATAANQALVAALPDPNTYTRMANPTVPFEFSAPDLQGQTVAWNDARFKGKVVAISITGSWCPNCHEEAPFLQAMYDKYNAQGLEVVALAFEYTGEQQRDQAQLRIFGARHGVKYPLLWAGSTDDAPQKLKQLVNFGAYPTLVLVGRDGLVKHIHAGFEGRATGTRAGALKQDLEARLLALLQGEEK